MSAHTITRDVESEDTLAEVPRVAGLHHSFSSLELPELVEEVATTLADRPDGGQLAVVHIDGHGAEPIVALRLLDMLLLYGGALAAAHAAAPKRSACRR